MSNFNKFYGKVEEVLELAKDNGVTSIDDALDFLKTYLSDVVDEAVADRLAVLEDRVSALEAGDDYYDDEDDDDDYDDYDDEDDEAYEDDVEEEEEEEEEDSLENTLLDLLNAFVDKYKK